MKKVIAALLSVTLILCLFAGCGKKEEAKHDEIKINLSMTATLEEHHGAIYIPFAEYVHEKCPWITIEVFPSSTLYDDSTFVDAIMRGNVDMGITAPGYIGEYAPETSIFGACYIFNDVDHMNRVMNGEIGKELYDKVAEETGIRMLGCIYKGRRCVNLVQDKEVKCRADLEGVLLRVPNAESWLNMGRALGATPTPMALSEVYLALQAGTVEGQDNPLQATMNYGFGEVTKSISMTNHVIDINWVCIREDLWQSFDAETQQVFLDATKKAYEDCRAAYDNEDASLIAKFREMGVHVYENIDTSVMKQEVWDWYWAHPEVSGNWSKEIYDKVNNA